MNKTKSSTMVAVFCLPAAGPKEKTQISFQKFDCNFIFLFSYLWSWQWRTLCCFEVGPDEIQVLVLEFSQDCFCFLTHLFHPVVVIGFWSVMWILV